MQLREQDKNVGFSQISDGWHAFKIVKVEFQKDKETEVDTKSVRVELMAIDDENEGSLISMFCKLDTKFGRSKLGRVVGWTKIDKVIESKYKLPPEASKLYPDAWGDKFLDVDNPKDAKIINAVMVELVDKKLKGLVSTTMSKSDAEGKTREYHNVDKNDFYDAPTPGGAMAGPGAKKTESDPEFPVEAGDEW
jgi:hypothetical protein